MKLRILKKWLLRALGLGLFLLALFSPPAVRFGLQLALDTLSDRGTVPALGQVSGWPWTGYRVASASLVISGQKLSFGKLSLSLRRGDNSLPGLVVELDSLSLDSALPQGDEKNQSFRGLGALEIQAGQLIRGGCPWWFSRFSVNRISAWKGLAVNGLELTPLSLRAGLMSSPTWKADTLELKSAGLDGQDRRIRWKATGSFYLNGQPVETVLTRDGQDELTLCLFGEKGALGGLDLTLRWLPGKGPLRIVMNLTAESLSRALGLSSAKSGIAPLPFKLMGDVSVEVEVDTGFLESCFQNRGMADLDLTGLRGRLITSGNSLETRIDGRVWRLEKITGPLLFARGKLSTQGLTARCLDIPITISGSMDIRNQKDSAVVLEYSDRLTPLVINRLGIGYTIPGDIDFSVPVKARLEYKPALGGRGVSYRLEASSGSMALFGEKFSIRSLVMSGTPQKGSVNSQLMARQGLVRLNGTTSDYRTLAFDFSSDSIVPGLVGKVRIDGPVRFAGKGTMNRELDVHARILLKGNGVELADLSFTDVEGTLELDRYQLRGVKLKGDIEGSPVDINLYEHDLKNGDFTIRASALSIPASRVLQEAGKRLQSAPFPEGFEVRGRMGLELNLKRQSKKWSISGKSTYHDNEIGFTSPGLAQLFPDMTMKISGSVSWNSGVMDFTSLTIRGRVPEAGEFTIRALETDRAEEAGRELVLKAEDLDLGPLLVRLTRAEWIKQARFSKVSVTMERPMSLKIRPETRDQVERAVAGPIRFRAASGELQLASFKMPVTAVDGTIDCGKLNPGIMAMDADYHSGKIRILDFRKGGLGSLSLSDASIANLMETNGLVPRLEGRMSVNASAQRVQKGHWTGRVALLIKQGAVLRGLVPQVVIDKLFKTPFINPLELDWAGAVFRLDTSSEWLLSTFEPDAQTEEWPEAPYYMKVESDKMKLAGDLRIGKARELEATLVAQFPSSVSQYVKLGPFRSFFTRQGGALVPFRRRRETAVYLPFRLGGTLEEPSCSFDPEKQILRQVVGNPLKLFNFIVPNLF